MTLAVFLPPEIGVKADPLAPPPENVKPEWYFLFLMQTLKLFPGSILGMNGETIAIVLVSAAILFFFLIPFFDKKSSRGEKSPLFTWIGVIYLLYFLTMMKLFPGEILGMNGETIAIVLVAAAILFFFLIPFFDTKSSRGEKSPLFTWIGVIYLLYFLTMTAVGFFS